MYYPVPHSEQIMTKCLSEWIYYDREYLMIDRNIGYFTYREVSFRTWPLTSWHISALHLVLETLFCNDFRLNSVLLLLAISTAWRPAGHFRQVKPNEAENSLLLISWNGNDSLGEAGLGSLGGGELTPRGHCIDYPTWPVIDSSMI